MRSTEKIAQNSIDRTALAHTLTELDINDSFEMDVKHSPVKPGVLQIHHLYAPSEGHKAVGTIINSVECFNRRTDKEPISRLEFRVGTFGGDNPKRVVNFFRQIECDEVQRGSASQTVYATYKF